MSIRVFFVRVFSVKRQIITPLTDFPGAFSSVINLVLKVTSKNCSCVCPSLTVFSLFLSYTNEIGDHQGHSYRCPLN